MPEIEYLPFKAINVYIEQDYLEKVIKDILEGLGSLSKEEQNQFTRFIRRNISILGFRNPARAPQSLQINAYKSAFVKNEDVIPFTLATWAKIKSDLAQKVKTWLESEGWNTHSLERPLDEMIGFTAAWPNNLTFEEIEEKFKQAQPEVEYQRDDLILMVLWISGTLPKA